MEERGRSVTGSAARPQRGAPAETPSRWHTLSMNVAAYAIWGALSLLGVWALFQLLQGVVNVANMLIDNRWVVALIDRVTIVVLGLTWLGLVVVCQAYLHDGIARGTLWRRSLRALLTVLAVIGVGYGLQLLVLLWS